MDPARAASPAGRNPFARATPDAVVTRRRLLPTAVSPIQAAPAHPAFADTEGGQGGLATASTVDATPVKDAGGSQPHVTPSQTARAAWRMLWRGGLEVGPDGWRLDGITFFAQLAFPTTTPTHLAPTPHPSSPAMQTDADLCLSLESLRGRKFLSVRRVEPLSEEEKLEGVDGGVQMSISNPLVAAFFTSLLCRNPKLAANGRTLTAVVIGLGDEGERDSVLVYGQLQSQGYEQPTLRLNVGRRVPPPPSDHKVRPGEPLPRAPLLFPDKAPARRPPPIPRALSRSTSVASMYAPPAKKQRTEDDDTHRRRKSTTQEDEDIFGMRRSASLAPSTRSGRAPSAASSARSGRAPSAAPSNRSTRAPSAAPTLLSVADEEPSTKAPKQVLKNKDTVRKQTLLAMEGRGCPREHDQFKDVFSTTIRGVYFAFRAELEPGPLDKTRVQEVVTKHLDMYFPIPVEGPPVPIEAPPAPIPQDNTSIA